MSRLSGVLVTLALMASGLGFASIASAETIKVDVDGDKVKDPVVASNTQGALRVGALLSSAEDRFTVLEFNGSQASEPFIKAKGKVNKGGGAELFVQTGKNPTVDTISVLTIKRKKLINAGNFLVNSSLSDGFAAGMRCGVVQGKPGIRAFYFKLGSAGRWNRSIVPFQWNKGRLEKRGSVKKSKVSLPPATQRVLGCPTAPVPPPPPEPPPVLGSSGNRFLSGLGRVEPARFHAREGTGRYFGFKWRGWGRARATARGFFNTGTGGGNQRMNLTAFDRGQCDGRDAYRRLTLKAARGGGITLNVC